MKKPTAILFDLGDTLLRSEEFIPLNGVKELLRHSENPLGISAEQIQTYAEQLLKDMGEFEKGKLLQLDNKSFTRLIYETHGISFDKTAEELDFIFLNSAEMISPIEGIGEVLEYFDKKKIRLAVLSNTGFSEYTHRMQLRRFDLEKYFEFFIATSEYCIRKPDRRIFDLALSKLQLCSDDVWYIGNKFEYDIVGANNASMFSVWLNEKNKKGDTSLNYLSIRSYSELLKKLKENWD